MINEKIFFDRKIKMKKLFKNIPIDSFEKGAGWSDNVTFHCYVFLREKERKILHTNGKKLKTKYLSALPYLL